MPDDLAKDFTPEQRNTYLKAKEASDRNNHDYAITLLSQLVQAVPGHLEARRLLRANSIIKHRGSSGLAKSMNSVKIQPLILKGRNALKKNPIEALQAAEEALLIDPTGNQANQLLADAADALGATPISLFAFETLRDTKPDDVAVLKQLGQAYLKAGSVDKAITTFQKAYEIAPTDGAALKGLKDASAMQATSKGGWEQEGDFRDQLKDADQAKLLEQQSRVVKSDEAIDAQLAVLMPQYNENPQNLNVVKQIAALYERRNDLASALTFFEWAFHLSNQADPELEKRIHKIRQQQKQNHIKELEEKLASATPEEKAAIQAELDTLQVDRAGFELASAQERVKRYPNDLNLRFELGRALVNAGQYKEAVPELQQALKQPNARYQAYNLLGVAFWKRKMLDFAVKQFQTAKSEMLAMDNLKKEIVYNLGCVLEESGKKDEALEQFKEIYEVDSQFKDVAERVERSYGHDEET
jgi:tetratricopeptide (TPR) repeat protein